MEEDNQPSLEAATAAGPTSKRLRTAPTPSQPEASASVEGHDGALNPAVEPADAAPAEDESMAGDEAEGDESSEDEGESPVALALAAGPSGCVLSLVICHLIPWA